MAQNTRTRSDYRVFPPFHYTECFCPFCRTWQVDWGGGSLYRNRRVCPRCTYVLEHRKKR